MTELMNFDYSIIIRLVIAVILGGLIGLERGGGKHEAGFRTHIVLCLGAALVMIIAENITSQYGGDVTRMGAQVISGVGFLGVGSIIVDGNKIRGITTAAGLWTTACIGLAVGSGYYIIAIAATALMLFALLGLHSLRSRWNPKHLKYSIKFDITSRTAMKEILKKLIDEDVQIYSVKLEEDDGTIGVMMELRIQKDSDVNEIIRKFTSYEGVTEFEMI